MANTSQIAMPWTGTFATVGFRETDSGKRPFTELKTPSAEGGNAIIQAVWQRYSLHFEGTAVLPEIRKNM